MVEKSLERRNEGVQTPHESRLRMYLNKRKGMKRCKDYMAQAKELEKSATAIGTTPKERAKLYSNAAKYVLKAAEAGKRAGLAEQNKEWYNDELRHSLENFARAREYYSQVGRKDVNTFAEYVSMQSNEDACATSAILIAIELHEQKSLANWGLHHKFERGYTPTGDKLAT